MKSLKNIFHKKQKQEPKPLRVEDVAPAPMTPEPDDAELAAMALLEKMAEIKGVSRNNFRGQAHHEVELHLAVSCCKADGGAHP